MKRFSSLFLITSLGIAYLPWQCAAATTLLIQPLSTEASAQKIQAADLPRKDLCPYQRMHNSGTKYWNDNWCREQTEKDKKAQDRKEQDRKEQDRKEQDRKEQDRKEQDRKEQDRKEQDRKEQYRKARERDRENKEYWDKQHDK